MGKAKITTVNDVCQLLERIAPTRLAQSWDNVGLLAGDRSAEVRNMLLCIDLMPAVAGEAVKRKASMVVAYHPPLFKPIRRLVAPSNGSEGALLRCVAAGMAVYSPHTALDAVDEGTNDVLARLVGIADPKPVEWSPPNDDDTKVVVFVPPDEADKVSRAAFAAGAGVIHEYDHCSFRLPGVGTFRGSAASNPSVGQAGKLETVREYRVEMVCPRSKLRAVLDAIRHTHSYEEPAIDVYPTTGVQRTGMGRVGALREPTTLLQLARRLKRRTASPCVSLVGDPERTMRRAIVCVGSAGSLPFAVGLRRSDVIVTGEIRHHDALRIKRAGANAIALSHWSSERPALSALAVNLKEALGTKVRVYLSEKDAEPFMRV
jgi:dinuclear metal center YbgI/SA1388 family protein